jgi:hypothetical protein
MKYGIEIKEIVSKFNTYVIEVEDEDEGDYIAGELEQYVENATHPDEVMDAFQNVGTKVTEFIEGAEDVEYEMY